MEINKHIEKQVKQIIKNMKRIGVDRPFINEIKIPFEIETDFFQDEIFIRFVDENIEIKSSFFYPDLDNIFIFYNLTHTPKKIASLLKKTVEILKIIDE